MKDDKVKKDEYQKALAAFADAVKEYRKGRSEKAAEGFREFIAKFASEKELVDRARVYLSVITGKAGAPKEPAPLKTLDDYCHYAVYLMNAGGWEEAQKVLEKALKLEPDEPRVHYLLADLACLTDRIDDCFEHLAKAVKGDKGYRVMAQNEADFSAVRDDKRFKVLTRLA